MKKRNTIIVAVVAGVAVLILIVLFARKAKPKPISAGMPVIPPEVPPPIPDEVPPEPPPPYTPDPTFVPPPPFPDPEPPPEPPAQPPPAGPDPIDPSDNPIQGRYYIVKSGDTMFNILARAGFQAGAPRQNAYLEMLNHERNEWIGKTTYAGSDSLRLNRRFTPMLGNEILTWAYDTPYNSEPSPQWKWPVVYVPTQAEVGS